MGLIDFILRPLTKYIDSRHALAMKSTVALPTSGGRSSKLDWHDGFFSYMKGLQHGYTPFDVRIYDVIENLSIHHPDVSLAVDNIVRLGNTKMSIDLGTAKISEADREQWTEYLLMCSNHYYGYTSGIHTLVNDLLAQIVKFGCLSAEIVPKKDLSGIERIVRVPPSTIRFEYDNVTESWMPYQTIY